MNNFTTTDLASLIQEYLTYCEVQKRLDEKTLKAYRIDLRQFREQLRSDQAAQITRIDSAALEQYAASLHRHYLPKTVKRKLASVKAFFHYLEYRDLIDKNPFNKMQFHFREPAKLPKTIPLPTVERLLSTIYAQPRNAASEFQKNITLRDAAVIELLFSSGMRISELCSLRSSDVNLSDGTILIYGKGDKERRIQLGNEDVLHTLQSYRDTFSLQIRQSGHFFVNPSGHPLSDQTVRRTINHYCALAAIDIHITPHMFRHTFATSLLEADVDIRYIQEMLGHSSIHITEIYTHVAVAKQRAILAGKHPRKDFRV